MQRNDYRRSLILLRPLRRGMSGHVRLERRTLQGSMRFTVQGAAQGRLHALLLAQTSRGWTAHKLGALATDSRGQSGLHAVFDPRNLSGLDLNQYQLVALVEDGAEPEMVMSGLVNGARQINLGEAARVACDTYIKARAPARQAQAAQEEAAPEDMAQAEAAPEGELCCCETAEEAEDIVETPSREAEETAGEVVEDQAGEDIAEEVVEPEQAAEEITPEVAEDEGEDSEPENEQPASAGQVLGLDIEAQWPEEFASIKALFAKSPPIESFQLEDFVFVEAPLPSEDGAGGICAIGLRAQEGLPVSVCYALPGENSLEPPPGLEGYQYLGGWWYTVLSPQPEVNSLGEKLSNWQS